jgi:hypothetical protein
MMPAIERERRDFQRIEAALREGRNPLNMPNFNDKESLRLAVHEMRPTLRAFRARELCVRRFAWAVPTNAALAAIARYAPILEVGAGTGYWALLLRRRGVDILPTDRQPPRRRSVKERQYRGRQSRQFVPITRMGAAKAAGRYPQRSLFLCWPPHNDPMADQALAHYRGEIVIFIGEYDGGCNANPAFFKRLERRFAQIEEVSLPQWTGLHDDLTVWRRIA